MVLLVLERPRGEAADLLDDALAVPVGVRELDLGEARQPAAEVGHGEAALVARERLVGERTHLGIDEHPEVEVRLVRIARVPVHLDAEHAARDTDLRGCEPRPARGAHRLDEVVEEPLEARVSRAPRRQPAAATARSTGSPIRTMSRTATRRNPAATRRRARPRPRPPRPRRCGAGARRGAPRPGAGRLAESAHATWKPETSASAWSACVGAWPSDDSSSVVRLVANVERSARPSAPPICCDVLKRPDASPASSAGMPLVAISVIGTKTSPMPMDARRIPGSRPVRYELSGVRRRNVSSPAAPSASPIRGTSRAPSAGTSRCERPAPTITPAVNGTNANPASSGENPRTRWT